MRPLAFVNILKGQHLKVIQILLVFYLLVLYCNLLFYCPVNQLMIDEFRIVIISECQRFAPSFNDFCRDCITLWADNGKPKSIAKLLWLQLSMILKVRIGRSSLSESLIKSIDHTWLISDGTLSASVLSRFIRDLGFILRFSSNSR